MAWLSTVCAAEAKDFPLLRKEKQFFLISFRFFSYYIYSSDKRITNKGLGGKTNIKIISDNGSLEFNKTVFKSTVKRKS